jgi:hypothetical protein
VGTSCVLGSNPLFTPVIHPTPFQCTTCWKKSTQSDQAQQVLSLTINYNTTPRPNPFVYTVIFKVAISLKDTQVGTQNGSFSSDTEPTDFCRSCTWKPSGVKHFQLPSKDGSASNTVTCPPQTRYMRQSNYEHNAKEELHLLQEKKPKVSAMLSTSEPRKGHELAHHIKLFQIITFPSLM